jgi:hypothetical protein
MFGLLLTLILALSLSQTTAARQASLEGFVTASGTGRPLREARVSLVKVNSETGTESAVPSAVTDATGRFVFTGIEPGEYRLSAERFGFIRQNLGQKKINGIGTTFRLQADQRLTVAISLVPGAVITGRVLDEQGEPMTGAIVNAQSLEYLQGKRVPMPVGQGLPLMASRAVTDDRGEYRLFWFAPGDYYISVFAAPRFEGSATVNAGTPVLTGRLSVQPPISNSFAAVYYPGVTGIDAATPVRVPISAEVRGVDINWRPVHLASVRGQFILPEIPPMLDSAGRLRLQSQGGSIALTAAEGGRGISTGAIGGGDQFEFRNVAPGSYYLNILQRRNDLTFFGRARVEVLDRDMDNLIVGLQPASTLRGRIVLDSAPSQTFAMNQLRLSAGDDVGWGSNTTTQVVENGTFALARVPPTKLRLTMAGLPNGAFVAAARYGTTDLLVDDFVPVENQDLELHISFASGKVTGIVIDPMGKPYSPALVTMVPEERKRARPDLFFTRNTDAGGRFVFSGVPEGAYQVFAWEQIPPGAHQSSEFIQNFEGRGRFVRVTAGSSDELQVQLISDVN